MATDTTARKVPKRAFQLDAGPLQFAAAAADGKMPVHMLARTPQPIDHWYWGRIVHDMTGMQLRKETAPIDWCHDYDEIMGYLDQFQASPQKGLEVGGFLVPFQPDDRASEVTAKGKAGVPYEASIDWSGPGARIEEIGEGVTVQVNGFAFTGPGYVVRQWPLRAVAVCPYGADSNTRTEFAAEEDEIEVSIFSEGSMSKDAKPAAAATQQTATPPAGATQLAEGATPPAAGTVLVGGAAEAAAQLRAEVQKFVAKFGAANGSKWFSEGKSFAEALELHVAEQDKQLAALAKERDDAKEKLSSLKLGEDSPVTTGDADGKTQQTPGKAERFGAIGKFAAGLKLPGSK